MRYSSQQVEQKFASLIRMMGGQISTEVVSDDNIGKYQLDYHAEYGGYTIERFTSRSGTTKPFFGGRRMGPSEFVNCIEFAITVLEERNGNEALAKQQKLDQLFLKER